MTLESYRPNVGVVLFNREGKVWLGRRVNGPGPNNWQFPQGGVDKGEDLLAAASTCIGGFCEVDQLLSRATMPGVWSSS